MLRTLPDPARTQAYRTGALVLFGAVAAIATALAFEYLGG